MSLQFSQDPLSKREKQERFKKSLDDQRRMKQESSTQQHQLPSHIGNQGYHVPGLAATLPDDLNAARLNHVPGLDQHQPGGSYGHAPRFEACPSPQQEKQPYMSALSEMNGRPLHVRQQQFQKESQYRNMLKDQIEENKKKKDAEKAKLNEEKRRELEEVRRLQGIPAPRRQQHAQFQESPDHPLPSPGRLPPARHNPVATDQQQRRNGDAALQNYDRTEGVTPLHASSGGYASRNPPGVSGLDVESRWQGRQNMPADRQEHQESLGGDHRRSYVAPRQTNAAAFPNDFAVDGRRDLTSQARTDASSGHIDGYGQGVGEEGRPRGRFDASAHSLSGESAARKLAFERGGRGGEGATVGQAGDVSDSSVSRADFDELSSLCRDLLLEQKQLRQKLEEHKEREQVAAERTEQEDEMMRQQQQRGIPRRGGGRTVATRGDGRRRAPSLPGSTASRVQGNKVRDIALCHDGKPRPKPGVAFGSTKSRMPSPTAENPRVAAGSKSRAPRGGRDTRVSKSEPIPRTENLLDLRHVRNVVSTNGGAGGSGGKSFANREASDSGWPSNAIKGARDATGGQFADPDRSVGGHWTSREEGSRDSRGVHASEMGGAGSSTIHGLLGNSTGRHGLASKETEARQSQGVGTRIGSGNSELGGESTFLAAHPMDSGLMSSEAGTFALQGRGVTGRY